MTKSNVIAAVLIGLSVQTAWAGMPSSRAGAPVAGSFEEVSNRLEREINRASEQGRYAYVQALRLELAEHYASKGSYALAARQYELLLASRPSKSERVTYFIALGKMRDADRDYNAAIGSFLDALHDNPKSWEANLCLAHAYDHAELNSRAIEEYQRCIKLKPSAIEPYVGIAGVYQQLGFLNKAVANYLKALTLEKRPETYLALADTYVRQGDVARARDILQQAKAVVPRVEYDVRLGDVYRRYGDLLNACLAWEEALKADPKRTDVQLQLALAYNQLDRRTDSDRLFTRLLADFPQSPLVHFSRAWVYYSRGDRDAARREALLTQRLVPTPGVAHYNDELLSILKKQS